jgi:hypothetical protein
VRVRERRVLLGHVCTTAVDLLVVLNISYDVHNTLVARCFDKIENTNIARMASIRGKGGHTLFDAHTSNCTRF